VKVIYDRRADTLILRFAPSPAAESDERAPNVILDYDARGNLVAFTVLHASRRARNLRSVDFELSEGPVSTSEG
jgi:uncharacterized protein YuzE